MLLVSLNLLLVVLGLSIQVHLIIFLVIHIFSLLYINLIHYLQRKNRHLLDTARTLLLHHHVPFCFWADAVLAACYLINRMPSSVIDNKIPHECLFPTDPLSQLSLRVFGCTCFVHDHSPGRDKLSPRAIKCVFLGYSRVQKGYKCFDHVSRRYHFSVDVTFF